ncbi:21496_t:CDS:2, partial [Gigaspora margarita]
PRAFLMFDLRYEKDILNSIVLMSKADTEMDPKTQSAKEPKKARQAPIRK